MSGRRPALRETPSQTAGPFVHIGLDPAKAGLAHGPAPLGHRIAGAEVPGQRIRIEGRVLDGDGAPVTDALIEVWQADAQGAHAQPTNPGRAGVAAGFTGFGRVSTDFETGLYAIETVKPGSVALPDGRVMAPHLGLLIFARGINMGLHTRAYFPEDRVAHRSDPILSLIDPPARRQTLIAQAVADAGEADGQTGRPASYRFDIHLQGASETVFLSI